MKDRYGGIEVHLSGATCAEHVVLVGCCDRFARIRTRQAVAEVGPVGAFDAELRQGAGS